MKQTPLNQWHKDKKGKMVEFGGWEMPLNYEKGIIEEHLHTRKSGSLFDVSHMGRFLISGKNAVKFLQYVLTNNAKALEPGKAQYTIIPNENGGAIDDAYLYRINEKEYILVVNASNTEKDWTWLAEHIKKFQPISMENKTEEISMIAIQGPKSKKVLERITQEVPEPGRNNIIQSEFEGKKIVISRTGYTGEPLGFEIFTPTEKTTSLWEKILNTEKGDILPAGLGARDTLRLEAMLPLYGHELGTDIEGKEIPIYAIPLAKHAVSFSKLKGNFIGKKELKKQFEELKQIEEKKAAEKKALPKRIFYVSLTSQGVARAGFKAYKGDKQIGYVTSGTMVPYWKFEEKGAESRILDEKGMRAICLAYLNSETETGEKIKIESRGKFLESEVVEKHLGTEAPPYARPIIKKEKTEPEQKESLKSLMIKLAKDASRNTEWRQKETINLIPSEQTPSPLVRLLTIADPSGRYAEHKEVEAIGGEVFYYQGTKFIAETEQLLAKELKKYLGCEQVETRIISGQMANTAVFSSLVSYLNRLNRKKEPKRLKKVMNNSLGKGGHLSAQPMGALKDYVAIDPVTEKPAVINFPALKGNPYKIDLEETAKLIAKHKPELIILGKSMILHPEPVKEIKQITESMKKKPVIMYDMAHVLGLIGPYFQEPFKEGADIVTGSTHKTFFGPQRGVIGANVDEELWEYITKRTFPGSVSNHHLGTMLGLLMTAYEMNQYGKEYQQQVIKNAKAFAKALKKSGLEVEGDPSVDYTETHQVILKVDYAKGAAIAEKLENNNIIVNYQTKPDDEGFSASSALRTGVQEMTRYGMKEKDFEELASYMSDIIQKDKQAKEEISKLRSKFTKMRYCLPEEQAKPLAEELIQKIIR